MARKTVMRRHSKTLPMSGDVIIDVEGREHEAAASATQVLSVEAEGPIALPTSDELVDSDTGEIINENSDNAATGMTEVDEQTARELDARTGNDGTLGSDNSAAAEGPADSQRGEPEYDDRPAWWNKVQWIRDGIDGAKNKQHVKTFDDELSLIRVALPDEVIEELDALIAAKRRELTKPQAEG
jgi:recombination protein RecT